jgi:hypothetical protein
MVMQLWHETAKIKVGRAGWGEGAFARARASWGLKRLHKPEPEHTGPPEAVGGSRLPANQGGSAARAPHPKPQGKAVETYIKELLESFLQGDEKFIVFAYHKWVAVQTGGLND